jgi:hypothetical protein
VVLFGALTVVVGGTLSAWDYAQIRAAALLRAGAGFARSAGAVQRDVRAEAFAAELHLRLLRTAAIVADRSAWAQPAATLPLTATLDTSPNIVAVYAGYPDGRFILARPLQSGAAITWMR